LLTNVTVLIAGGVTSSNHAAATAEIYEPSTGMFRTTGNMLHPRVQHTATLLPDGRVLICGGSDENGYTQFVELYDPATESFISGPNTGANLVDHTATLLAFN